MYAVLSKDDFQIPRFIAVGVVCTAVNLAVLYALTAFAGLWYLVSSIAAFCVSYAVNFTLQKLWTFKNRELGSVHRQLGLHLALQLGNLTLNTCLLYMLVEHVHLWYIAAQVSLDAVIAIESFILSRRIFACKL